MNRFPKILLPVLLLSVPGNAAADDEVRGAFFNSNAVEEGVFGAREVISANPAQGLSSPANSSDGEIDMENLPKELEKRVGEAIKETSDFTNIDNITVGADNFELPETFDPQAGLKGLAAKEGGFDPAQIQMQEELKLNSDELMKRFQQMQKLQQNGQSEQWNKSSEAIKKAISESLGESQDTDTKSSSDSHRF